jgi:hypothetical protein
LYHPDIWKWVVINNMLSSSSSSSSSSSVLVARFQVSITVAFFPLDETRTIILLSSTGLCLCQETGLLGFVFFFCPNQCLWLMNKVGWIIGVLPNNATGMSAFPLSFVAIGRMDRPTLDLGMMIITDRGESSQDKIVDAQRYAHHRADWLQTPITNPNQQ